MLNIKIKIFLLILGMGFVLIILKLIRNKDLRPSFSLLWFLISITLISIPIFNNFYKFISYNLLGFADATNIIYIVLIGFLLIYTLFMTIYISRISNRIQILVSHTSILEEEIKSLKQYT